MTLRRHTLLGQVLAVLSRRTPAFRPPPGEPPRRRPTPTAEPLPTADTAAELRLLWEAAAWWRDAPAPVRLWNRAALLGIAHEVTRAGADSGELARRLAAPADRRCPRRAPGDRVQPAHVLRLVDALARDLRLALRSVHYVERDLQLAQDAAGDLSQYLADARARGRPAPTGTDHTTALLRGLAHCLDSVAVVVERSATDFTDADLSRRFSVADLEPLDLTSVRWNGGTRWPDREWAARLRRASVEEPPGSGVFVVRAGEERP